VPSNAQIIKFIYRQPTPNSSIAYSPVDEFSFFLGTAGNSLCRLSFPVRQKLYIATIFPSFVMQAHCLEEIHNLRFENN
jgi:hypothetical protein